MKRKSEKFWFPKKVRKTHSTFFFQNQKILENQSNWFLSAVLKIQIFQFYFLFFSHNFIGFFGFFCNHFLNFFSKNFSFLKGNLNYKNTKDKKSFYNEKSSKKLSKWIFWFVPMVKANGAHFDIFVWNFGFSNETLMGKISVFRFKSDGWSRLCLNFLNSTQKACRIVFEMKNFTQDKTWIFK